MLENPSSLGSNVRGQARVWAALVLLGASGLAARPASAEVAVDGFVSTKLAALRRSCDKLPASDQDDCVINGVAALLKSKTVITDCQFSSNVTKQCKIATPGKQSPWKKCPNLWAAYNNEGGCGGAAGALSAKDGVLVAYLPLASVGKAPLTPEAERLLITDATNFILNNATVNGYAVCATVAQAGFAALRLAGLRGRLDIVEEPYGSAGTTTGHVYLLYNRAPAGTAAEPCGPGVTENTCGARYIDFWYRGLEWAQSEEPYYFREPAGLQEEEWVYGAGGWEATGRMVPKQVVNFHRQGKFEFHAEPVAAKVGAVSTDDVEAMVALADTWTPDNLFPTASVPTAGALKDEVEAMAASADTWTPAKLFQTVPVPAAVSLKDDVEAMVAAVDTWTPAKLFQTVSVPAAASLKDEVEAMVASADTWTPDKLFQAVALPDPNNEAAAATKSAIDAMLASVDTWSPAKLFQAVALPDPTNEEAAATKSNIDAMLASMDTWTPAKLFETVGLAMPAAEATSETAASAAAEASETSASPPVESSETSASPPVESSETSVSLPVESSETSASPPVESTSSISAE